MADASQREFFDRLASPFRERYQRSAAFRERRALFLDAARAAKAHSSGLRCLDLGCGPGVLSQDLAALGFSVTGVDFSEEMVAQARAAAPEQRFVVGELEGFLEEEERRCAPRAALIVCSSVLEYLPDPLRVLRLAAGRLEESGTMLLSIPNRASILRALEPLARRGHGYRAHWKNRLGLASYLAAARELGLASAAPRHFGFPWLPESRLLGPLSLLALRKPAGGPR